MRPHLMQACARGPNPHVRQSRAAMFANGLRHFTHCCAAGPKPHELQSCASVAANGAPHVMHWDAFGPKPQVAQRWAVVDMGDIAKREEANMLECQQLFYVACTRATDGVILGGVDD